MSRRRFLLPALLLSFISTGCAGPSPATGPARRAEGPVLVRVAPADTPRFLRKLSAVPGVWGVQRHPPEFVIFIAPKPWPNVLSAVLGARPHWSAPVPAPARDAYERRVFAVFGSLFAPLATPPVGLEAVMPPQADAFAAPAVEGVTPGGRFRPQSYAPANYDRHTSEYLAGSIAVGILLPESNGAIDADTETWTASEVDTVVSEVTQGLLATQDACRGCGFDFVVELFDQHAPPAVSGTVETDYEPILHPFNDMNVNNNVLSRLGVTGATVTDGFRQLANQLRAARGTDWAVVVKVARNTAAGNIPYNGSALYAATYLGGPFMALTLGNDTWGTAMLDSTLMHELNHAFYALDEYTAAGQSPSGVAGYFKVVNAGSGFNDGTGFLGGSGEDDGGCVMNHTNPSPPYRFCAHTQGQIGWIDDDADGVLDVMQRPPAVAFACGSGTAAVSPTRVYADYPANFTPHAAGLGTIARVEFRVNQLTWLPAAPQDGAFDSPVEAFTVAASLPNGNYAVEARAVDSFGNTTLVPPRSLCAVSGSSVVAAAPFAAVGATPNPVAQGANVAFDASESSDLAAYRRGLQFRWDWNGDAAFDTAWSAGAKVNHAFAAAGTYTVVVEVKNAAGLAATRAVDVEVLPVANLPPVARLRADGQYAGGTQAPVFSLSALGSRDPEGAALTVRWDLDGDGTWDTPYTAALVTSATYAVGASASHSWVVAAQVADPAGNASIAYLHLRAVAYDHVPVAVLAQPAPLGGFKVGLDASASGDSDAAALWDQLLEYRWDFEGDGAFDTTYSTLPQIEHTYDRYGAYSPTVEVRDRFRLVGRQSQGVNFVGPAPTGLTVDPSDPLHLVLTWNSVGGAAAYRVQVAADASFTNVVIEDRSTSPQLSLPTLPAGTYAWRVSALSTYYDTVAFSAPATLAISGPGVTALAITPARPATTDKLQAGFTLTGGATAAATHIYWTRDGKRVAAFDDLKTVPADATKKGEMWITVVTPGDGQRVGAQVTSDPVVVENSPPAVTAAHITAEGNDLVCTPEGGHDDDDDALEFRSAWTHDGAALELSGARISMPGAGEYVCTLTPFDGESEGQAVQSAPYEVSRTPEADARGGCNSGRGGFHELGWVLLALALSAVFRKTA